MSSPKISIIVPVYNVIQYLSCCIDSILAQTFPDFELLLIDDGSTDRSGSVCDEYAAKDKRVRVFHKENGGVSSARNLGLDNARGEWVCFVDSDDWVNTEYLQRYYDAVYDSSFVLGYVNFPDKKPIHLTNAMVCESEMVGFILTNKCLEQSGPVCKLFSLKVIKENKLCFPLQIHYGEDAIFFTSYLNCIDKLSAIDYSGYNYRMVENSLSRKYNSFESEWDAFLLWKREMEFLVSKYGELSEVAKEILWNNRIGETFIRCFHCVLRPLKYSYSVARCYLEAIPENLYDEFGCYYHPNDLNGKIIKLLIVHRLFYLLRMLDRIYGCLKK